MRKRGGVTIDHRALGAKFYVVPVVESIDAESPLWITSEPNLPTLRLSAKVGKRRNGYFRVIPLLAIRDR